MGSRVIITIRGWDESKGWLEPTSYTIPWLERRLLKAGLGRREAKQAARQFGRREVLTFPALFAKDQFELDGLEGLARQLGDVGAIVEVGVVVCG
jgi:hypothetical protein